MSLPTFDPGFSTEELTAIYSARSTVAAMLEFESALVMAMADVGLAPLGEVEIVAAACQTDVDEPESVLESTWESGTPVIALRAKITSALDDEAARWFHHGATSQDVIDTGQMLQAKAALGALDELLVPMAQRLHDLTVRYRDQPQMGRTFLQDARPTTFGFRTATWLDSVMRCIADLRREREGLVVQLGGPVGTLSGYGETGTSVVARLAARLDLGVPDISWHTDRSRISSLADALQRCAATMSKIGMDIAILASSQIAEIAVRSGGSSSMSEKRNPIDATRAVAAASACSGAATMLRCTPPGELDRAVGAWHVEWIALPLVFRTAGAAIEAISRCLDSLEVDEEAMSRRVEADQSTLSAIVAPQIDSVLAAFDRLAG